MSTDATGLKAAIATHWDGHAPAFDGAASHRRHWDEWRRVFAAALPCPPTREIADLGTGTGACALLLASLGHRVRGIDISAGMLAQARAEADRRGLAVTFLEGDLENPPLPDGAFDAVTLRNVLWTQPDPAAAVRTARRLLRPGGTVLVSDGLWRPPGASSDHHYAADLRADLPFYAGISREHAETLLREAGFDEVRSWGHLFTRPPYPEPQASHFHVLTATPGA